MSETPAADAAEEFIEEFDGDIWIDETEGPSLVTKMLAEVAGTFILVLLGVGTALMLGFGSKWPLYVQNDTGGYGQIGYSVTSNPLVVGLAFGIAVIIAAVSFGQTSGAHLNPGITFGLWLGGRFPGRDVVPYILAQVIGGLFAGGVLYAFVATNPAVPDAKAAMGTAAIGFGDHSPAGFGLAAGLIVEALATGLLVLVVLSATARKAPASIAPFAIGLTLSALVVFAMPVTNAGINPARATATAAFAGGWAVAQLWAFWVAPLIGAAIVGLLYRAFAPVDEVEIVEVIEVIED